MEESFLLTLRVCKHKIPKFHFSPFSSIMSEKQVFIGKTHNSPFSDLFLRPGSAGIKYFAPPSLPSLPKENINQTVIEQNSSEEELLDNSIRLKTSDVDSKLHKFIQMRREEYNHD
jgi:hypothetical protein